MSQFLVSVESPNQILGVETSQCELMGYNPINLIGESFKILYGPRSDSSAIGRAIIEASLTSTFTELTGALYDFHGHAQALHMSFSPCSRLEGHPFCCLVTLNESEPPTQGLELTSAACFNQNLICSF